MPKKKNKHKRANDNYIKRRNARREAQRVELQLRREKRKQAQALHQQATKAVKVRAVGILAGAAIVITAGIACGLFAWLSPQ